MLTIGSLFAGIGGLELGLERALGAEVVWQVEREPFCLRVLEKHWPNAMRFDDVETAENLPYVDVICGGFPCQDISAAGKGAGLDGARSGLWREFRRIVEEVRPFAVVVENVPALRTRGLARVVADLDALGYVGEWGVVSAASVGAPHLRRRLFIIAVLADADVQHEHLPSAQRARVSEPARTRRRRVASDADSSGRKKHHPSAVTDESGLTSWRASSLVPWCGWLPASAVRRVGDGIPAGMDRPRRRRPANDKHRLKALGNAVVPQVAEVVGARLLSLLD